jgi:transposase InsO family protein
MKIDFSRPGKPTDNAFVESFNGTFRAECLNAHWFGTLAEACGGDVIMAVGGRPAQLRSRQIMRMTSCPDSSLLAAPVADLPA